MDYKGWQTKVIDTTWPIEEGPSGMTTALDRIRTQAQQAVLDGFSFIVLSDRMAGATRAAIPALLATGAVHHHLVANETRTRVGLLVEAADAHKVHDFCCLIGFGADAICPYLAMETILALREDGRLGSSVSGEEYLQRYIKAINGGVLKVMSKMGISTIASYKGAQIFEALGLAREVINTAFVGTASRIAGVDLATIAQDTLRLHGMSHGGSLQRMSDTVADAKALPDPGEYNFRSMPEREMHLNDPVAIAKLQEAAREGDRNAYTEFARITNELNQSVWGGWGGGGGVLYTRHSVCEINKFFVL